MSRSLQLTFQALVLFIGAPSLPAQNDPCTTRTLPVTVVDQQGNLVTGLTAANFRGKFRGKPVEILSVTPDTRPRRIVILVDVSGSMVDSEDEWNAIQLISTDATRMNASENKLGLIVFADSVLQKVPLGADAGVLSAKLAVFKDEAMRKPRRLRKTALWDAVNEALRELSPALPGDAIYAITDGDDNASRMKPRKLEGEMVARGTRLFAFALVNRVPRAGTRGFLDFVLRDLSELIKATGGNFVSLRLSDQQSVGGFLAKETNRSAVLLSATRTYQEIDRYYSMHIKIPSGVQRWGEWDLEAIGPDGKLLQDVEIHYPRKLLPCGAN